MNIVSLSFGQYPVRQPNSQYHLIDHVFSSAYCDRDSSAQTGTISVVDL